MKSQFDATRLTCLQMFFKALRQISIQLAIYVGSDEITLAELFLSWRHRCFLNPGDSFFDKLLSHHLARAEEPVLDSTEWQPCHFDDLFVAEVL